MTTNASTESQRVLGTSISETWLVALLGVYIMLRGVWVLGSGRQFVRRRVERWALAAGWVLSLIEMGRSASETATAQLPMFDVVLLGLFSAFALVLAVPGAVVEVAMVHRLIAERGRLLRARLVTLISRARNDREANTEEFDKRERRILGRELAE